TSDPFSIAITRKCKRKKLVKISRTTVKIEIVTTWKRNPTRAGVDTSTKRSAYSSAAWIMALRNVG
ncbi:hypothetical protein ACLKMY_38475, partial [Paraburkholderia mimosarum]